MKRILIMHIGLPKTGTTLIQEFLKANHENFAKKGIGVLSTDGNGAHYILGTQLLALDGNVKHPKSFFFW